MVKRCMAAFLTLVLLVISGMASTGQMERAKAAGISSCVYNAGGNTVSSLTGVTNQKLMNWLGSHIRDGYYLGTPYMAGDYRNPNGDARGAYGMHDVPGQPGLNCTGFVWHVLYKASGMSAAEAFQRIPCWRAAGGAGGWVTWLKNNHVEYKTYLAENPAAVNELIDSVVSDGYMETGDIIWTWDSGDVISDNGLPKGISSEHHIGIYTGGLWDGEAHGGNWTETGENQWWHSTSHSIYPIGMSGNGVTQIAPKTTCYAMTVVKLERNGYARLKKTPADSGFAEGNPCYSLQGAEYGVYGGRACTDRLALLVCDASGDTQAVSLPPGDYYIKEIKAPPGYQKDETVYPVRVEAQKTAVVNVEDLPVGARVSASLLKQDKDSADGAPQGGKATLAGAQFTWKYYPGYYTEETLPADAAKTWVTEVKEEKDQEGKTVFRTELLKEEYKVEGDEYYRCRDENILPLGTLTVQETKAPEGYRLEGAVLESGGSGGEGSGLCITQIRQNENEAVFSSGNQYTARDSIIRGDIRGVKVGGKDHKRLACVPFEITDVGTGESHVIVTDRNGEFSTSSKWTPHTANTNAGRTSSDGIWFGSAQPDDTVGALPYGTYTLTELPCKSNEGYELIPPFEVGVYRHDQMVNLGTLVDKEPEPPEIKIHTTAVNKSDQGKELPAAGQVTVVDTVSISGLEPGKKYMLAGWQMIREEQKELRVDGKRVEKQTVFTAEHSRQEIDMEFTFGTEYLSGRHLVTFEELYDMTDAEKPEKIAEHKDIEDEGQTVTVRTRQGEPPTDLVRTGDSQNLIVLILLWILSCIVIISCVTMSAWRRARKRLHRK